MARTDLYQLALDTLSGKTIGPSASCFRVNEAGIALAQSGTEAIPIIEEIITPIVIPALKVEGAGRWNSYGMMGLDYLMGAYLLIAVKFDVRQAFDFLKRQPVQIRTAAIESASTYFFKTNNGYIFGVAPNRVLLEFVREQADVGDLPDRQLVSNVYRQLSQQATTTPADTAASS